MLNTQRASHFTGITEGDTDHRSPYRGRTAALTNVVQ